MRNSLKMVGDFKIKKKDFFEDGRGIFEKKQALYKK
jgi:hypothetical protein